MTILVDCKNEMTYSQSISFFLIWFISVLYLFAHGTHSIFMSLSYSNKISDKNYTSFSQWTILLAVVS
jgi:hypothetical protein